MTEYVTAFLMASCLSDASKIKKLNGPKDWVRWNRYPNAETISKALEEAQKTNKKWQSSHPPKNLIARAKLSTTREKDETWYLDSAASVHMTYHLKDYIYPDLDNQQEDVEIANGQVLHTRGAETIALEVMAFGIPTYVHIHNVHYCPEIDSNLLSLGTFGAKGFEFYTKKDILHVKDIVGDIVLQSRCEGQVYPLLLFFFIFVLPP